MPIAHLEESDEMRSRESIHREFVARFHFGERVGPASEQELDAVETALDTKLPHAYRQFMTRHGAVYTPDILHQIVNRNLDHHDIKNIEEPSEAIKGTKAYWSGGMPDDVIGVASDCMGNAIGFRRQSAPSDDSPVWFFDHEFVEVYETASSFDALLIWYLDNL